MWRGGAESAERTSYQRNLCHRVHCRPLYGDTDNGSIWIMVQVLAGPILQWLVLKIAQNMVKSTCWLNFRRNLKADLTVCSSGPARQWHLRPLHLEQRMEWNSDFNELCAKRCGNHRRERERGWSDMVLQGGGGTGRKEGSRSAFNLGGRSVRLSAASAVYLR